MFGVALPTVPVVPLGPTGIGLTLPGIGVVSGVATSLRFGAVACLVSTEELFHERGSLSRSATTRRLERVRDHGFTQTPFARLLDYGHVHVSTPGGGGVELRSERADDPAAVNATITDNLDRGRSDYRPRASDGGSARTPTRGEPGGNATADPVDLDQLRTAHPDRRPRSAPSIDRTGRTPPRRTAGLDGENAGFTTRTVLVPRMEFGLLPVAATGHDTQDDRLSSEIDEMAETLSTVGIETVVPREYATDASTADAILDGLLADGADAIAAYHLTGGTEQTVVESLRGISRPVVLLGTSRENSFAAAVEARSALEAAGHPVELVFAADLDESTARELRSTVSARAIATAFEGFRLGLIGEQSPWLVSAVEDADRITSRLGPRLVRVDMGTVLEEVDAVPDERAEEVAETLDANAADRVEPDEADLVEAARIYLGLETLATEEALDAITVGCFELIPELGNTACYALAQLIDDGLVAGCEGDLQATLSMELLDRVTDDPVWMANTVAPDAASDEVTFAHCTIATDMLADPPILRSHFESGTGVAVQGELQAREVTLARLGGEAYDELFVATGRVSEGSVGREDMCRTQATIALDGDVDSYLDRTLGNHVAIGYGDVRDDLAAVAEELGVELVAV